MGMKKKPPVQTIPIIDKNEEVTIPYYYTEIKIKSQGK